METGALTSIVHGNGNRTCRMLARILPVACFIFLTTGCMLMAPRYPDSAAGSYGKDIRGFGEYVFRLQNRVSSRLILMMTEVDDEEDYERLSRAEGRILGACSALNEIAVMKAEKHHVGSKLKQEAYYNLQECEHVAREAELLIRDIQSEQ